MRQVFHKVCSVGLRVSDSDVDVMIALLSDSKRTGVPRPNNPIFSMRLLQSWHMDTSMPFAVLSLAPTCIPIYPGPISLRLRLPPVGYSRVGTTGSI